MRPLLARKHSKKAEKGSAASEGKHRFNHKSNHKEYCKNAGKDQMYFIHHFFITVIGIAGITIIGILIIIHIFSP